MADNRAGAIRQSLKEVWKGFFGALGALAAAYVVAASTNAFTTLRIDPLLQVVLALIAGLVVLLVMWVRSSARTVRERGRLKQQIRSLQAQLKGRPLTWKQMEFLPIRLSASHPEETVRITPPGDVDINVSLDLRTGNGFDAEITMEFDARYSDYVRSRGHTVIDLKRHAQGWNKTFFARGDALYFVSVKLSDSRAPCDVDCKVQAEVPE